MTTLRARHGLILMIAGGMLLGTVGVPLYEAGQHSLTAVWFRCLFGCLTLSAVLMVSGRLSELKLQGRCQSIVIITSLLMLLNWWLFFEAIQRTSIALATLVFHLQPFIVMALGAWWFGDRVKPLQWAAVGVAIIGLALVSDVVSALVGIKRIAPDEWVGLFMCLIGAFCYALVVILTKLVQTDRTVYSTEQKRPTANLPNPIVLVWWQCAVGTLILSWWPIQHGIPSAPETWVWLFVLGVLNTGLAYVLLYAGISRLRSGRIALLQFVYPITAVVVDGMVYGRVLNVLQSFGFVLMIVAIYITVNTGE